MSDQPGHTEEPTEPGMPEPPKPTEPARRNRNRRPLVIAAIVVVVAVVGGGVWWVNRPAVAQPTPTQSQTPTPRPTKEEFPANDTVYDLASLRTVDVFAVIPELPVDDRSGEFTGEGATPIAAGAAVFADPTGEPVGQLPNKLDYDGTTVPIIEKQANWVKVLLAGRQSVPATGQMMGWLRTQDVTLSPLPDYVTVSLSAFTIDIVRNGTDEQIANDFGYGRPETPTPVGRTFIMTVQSFPEMAYTRGEPIIYLSVQSPTLKGFGGADVAITAFHYHDQRTGSISNGCIRVGPETLAALSALPLGTPVIINA